MTILVTGANGFIGLNLVRHLAATYPNASIVALDLETGFDIRDRAACFETFENVKPTHFVHAAAITSTDDKASIQSVNVDGTVNVLDAAVAARSVQSSVILSSSAVYGTTSSPCDEDCALNLTSAYACAKRAAEMRMTKSETAGGFRIVAARVGPVYGPFERPRPSRPRPSLIYQLVKALADRRELRIAGTEMYRDWTHATDVGAALAGLLFAPKLNHSIYNVSAGEAVSARDIIKLFVERGLKVRWTADSATAHIVLNERDSRPLLVIKRLQQDTGFLPQFNIRSGIYSLIDSLNNDTN